MKWEKRYARGYRSSFTILDESGTMIAKVGVSTRTTIRTDEHHARLIAKAPELRETLRLLLVEAGQHIPTDTNCPKLAKVCHEARRLINETGGAQV